MKNSCRFHELADAYVHGELDSTQSGEYARHIERCAECSSEVSGLLKLKKLVGDSYAPVLDERFSYRVIASLRESQAHSAVKEVREAVGDIAISLVTLLAIVLLSVQLFRPVHTVPPVEMAGGLSASEQRALEPSGLSKDQVVEIALRGK